MQDINNNRFNNKLVEDGNSTIPFLPKDRLNSEDRDDETTTTEEELNTAGSMCSSNSNLRLTDNCIDDDIADLRTVTESESSHCHSSSIDENADSMTEHATDILDQETIDRSASELISDVLPMTTLQCSQQSDLNTQENSNRDDQVGASGLPSTRAESEESECVFSCQEPRQSQGISEYNGSKDTVAVSSVATLADFSEFSSSESPLDSREVSHCTVSGSLSDSKCEEEFQRIINDEVFQHPFNAIEYISSELAKSTVHLSNELERSGISINRARLPIEANYMRSSSRRAHILLKLGAVQMNHGRVDVAIGSFARSVKEIQAARKKEVTLALAANWLGIAFKSKNDWENAICCFRKAFSVRRRELGKDHVDTIESMNHLGSSLLHSGDIRGAQKCFRNVFWARKAIFGSSHPGVALASHDLANVLSALGNYSEAKKFYYTAWVIYHKLSLHKNHPSLVRLVQDIDNLKEMTIGARAEV